VLAVAVAVGPSSVWFAVQVGIVALAVNRVRSIGNYAMETDGDKKFCRFLFVFYVALALGASLAWWFVPLAEYWPPIMRVAEAWKLVVIVLFALIPIAAFSVMAFAFIVGAVNPASFAPYLPRSPSSELWDVFRPTDPPEYAEEDDGLAEARRTLEEMIQESVAKRQIIHRETRIVANRKTGNGNGLHLSPDPGSGETNVQDTDTATVETDTRESDGVMTLHIVEHGQQSMDVPVETARHYVERAWPDRFGSGMRAWQNRGLSDTSQKVIRQMLEIYGLIQPANGLYRETITWLVTRDEALEEFDRLFAKSAE
jgi:hypothetical protein